MEFIDINENNRKDFNEAVDHPLQSFEWGEFREKTGVKVIRRGAVKNGKIIDGFSLTVHKIPRLNYNIGYVPKGNNTNKEIITELKRIGKENSCIFIQLEPNIAINTKINKDSLVPSFHPLFTKYTFVLDLQKSEEDILKSFHSKTRYNIKVAQKHGVEVFEDNSEKAFNEYLRLTNETTSRQRFYAHTHEYHKKLWQTLSSTTKSKNSLTAHLFTAKYKKKTLVSWILFVFKDTLYYPYGASSSEFRNVMASNLVMWEAIKFGKKMGLKKFDMWGALGPTPNVKDPWYGFHKFKEGYGTTLTEFAGSFDLILNPFAYKLYKIADKSRWIYLRLKKTFQI